MRLITVTQLAEQTGFSAVHAGDVLNGRRRCSHRFREAVAACLGVPVEELFTDAIKTPARSDWCRRGHLRVWWVKPSTGCGECLQRKREGERRRYAALRRDAEVGRRALASKQSPERPAEVQPAWKVDA